MKDAKAGDSPAVPSDLEDVPRWKGSSEPLDLLLRRWRLGDRLGKPALFIISLFLFVLAITLMKEGARGVAPWLQRGLPLTSVPRCLGFGWLFAYLIMSGSPVAAAALTFFDAGAVDSLGAFAMITGSRLGANFIVLFVGFLYFLRGRDRETSLGMGLLSLVVTGTTYIVGMVLGIGVLKAGLLDSVGMPSGVRLAQYTDVVFGPIGALLVDHLPRWSLFLIGLAVVMVSFNLFDRCLPRMTLRGSHLGRVSRLVYRPWVMFLLGAGITLISMSVSISLGILVPLSDRGFVRRENVVPYIMGANITTFVDTLLAAVLLGNPAAFLVVLVEMMSISVVSILVLLLCYHRFERLVLGLVAWVTRRNRNIRYFMAGILLIPVALLVVA